MNSKNIIISLMILMLIPVSLFSQDGKAIFTATCTACHSIGKGTIVGPDLKDVTKTHSVDWIKKWIRGSQAMVEAKDPMAVEMFNKFNMIPMPDQALSDGEIKAVLDYITAESGGGDVAADKKSGDKKTDTAKVVTASDNGSSGTSSSASDKNTSVSQNTNVVTSNTNPDETKPNNPDKFFLILTISFVGFIFLGIVWALSYAINRLSKALADTSKKQA
jgi:cytochrome c551/c552